MNTETKPNRTKINLMVDITIFLAFLIVMEPHATGFAIHEWLGIAFGAAIVTHLLLHWQWIVETTKRIFSKISASQRINYALNILLFIDITIVSFTGIMISKSALPALGISLTQSFLWRSLHTLSADASLFLIGLHVALHWKWIVSTISRYVIQPIAQLHPAIKPAPVQAIRKEA
jgi:Domain of unknown function (DUF4405)